MHSRHQYRIMMTNAKTWPWFPYLPLKRQINSQKDLALLFYDFVDRDVKPVILLANLFLSEDEKKLCDKMPYKSFDDMLDDGWVID